MIFGQRVTLAAATVPVFALRVCRLCVCAGSRPTSHVEVGGGRVAHALGVGGHALVLPLVRLLAVLDLQRSCKAKRGWRGGCSFKSAGEGSPQLAALCSRFNAEMFVCLAGFCSVAPASNKVCIHLRMCGRVDCATAQEEPAALRSPRRHTLQRVPKFETFFSFSQSLKMTFSTKLA